PGGLNVVLLHEALEDIDFDAGQASGAVEGRCTALRFPLSQEQLVDVALEAQKPEVRLGAHATDNSAALHPGLIGLLVLFGVSHDTCGLPGGLSCTVPTTVLLCDDLSVVVNVTLHPGHE